jgi:hypothetical protein
LSVKDVIVARSRRFGSISAALVLATLTAWYVAAPAAHAQSGKGKPKPPKPVSAAEVKQIDARLEKLQTTFANESTAIIEGYERSGQYERAKFLLEVLLKLDPKNEAVKEKMAELDKNILKGTEFDLKFDTGSDWTPVGNVLKDKLVRVEASGDYRMMLTVPSLGPDGFATENVMRDLVGRVPTGALMGMVVTEANQSGKQPPEPFAIKANHEFTPKQDGTLFLKVNSPPGSKCTGDFKLKLSGVARAP